MPNVSYTRPLAFSGENPESALKNLKKIIK